MASVKLGSLLIRTLAKPISNKIKQQSQEHPRFRELCISLAQWTYRSEYRLRTSLLGESPKAIKPLSEAKAVSNGANMLAEGFLFAVAAGIILGETWRSSRSTAKRRDAVDDNIDELQEQVKSLKEQLQVMQAASEERWEDLRKRQEDVVKVLDRVVFIGMHGGWSQIQDEGSPLRVVMPNLPPDLLPSALPSPSPPTPKPLDNDTLSPNPKRED